MTEVIGKAFAYITREKDGVKQVLVFHHVIPEAGYQIPKGTIEKGESPEKAVLREALEETGLTNLKLERFLVKDTWRESQSKVHERFFYHLSVDIAEDEWSIIPTGSELEEQLLFKFFWISNKEEIALAPGHADYFHLIL
ncbi:NUDIX hydrolase [Longirhabdus pacifica]|uniref:NUDIX hydrolase n=1 Tax=Longirhabdus pacifica TaxID=2305227 RepID=UPI001F0C511D|nr:NUDIX domain-containing protein [Longirhabdus pacifica]